MSQPISNIAGIDICLQDLLPAELLLRIESS